MEERYYDSSGIAASSKREQLIKEAEEYRLHRHIATFQKLGKSEKQPGGESYLKFRFLPGAEPHLTSNSISDTFQLVPHHSLPMDRKQG